MKNQRQLGRRFACAAVAIAILCMAVIATRAGDRAAPTSPEDVQIFMRAKLSSSQRVMEGLVTRDFATIGRAAEEMQKMSKASGWPQARDDVYGHYSEEFRRQCGKLAKMAEKRDHEAAQFIYLHMTATCFDCHNYVRKRFKVARDSSNPSGPVQLIPTEWE